MQLIHPHASDYVCRALLQTASDEMEFGNGVYIIF